MEDKELNLILLKTVKELIDRVEHIEERGLRYEEWIDRPYSDSADKFKELLEQLKEV